MFIIIKINKPKGLSPTGIGSTAKNDIVGHTKSLDSSPVDTVVLTDPRLWVQARNPHPVSPGKDTQARCLIPDPCARPSARGICSK